MNGFISSLTAELKKVARSPVLPATFVFSAIMPVMMSFMMFVLKNPELASGMGLLGAKARLAGTADWPSYLSLLSQGMIGLQIVVFGFAASWIFGREYSDRTIKDLMALPVSRHAIVIAKFMAAAVWCTVLFLFVFGLSLAGGFLTGLPSWDRTLAEGSFITLLVSSLAVVHINSVAAFISCATRGYLAAVGFVILSAVFINFTGAIGFGEYYPWAVPMLYASGAGGSLPGITGWTIVILTGIAGSVGTLLWWRYADQN
jgi:ABC-2 type transport system permease protein